MTTRRDAKVRFLFVALTLVLSSFASFAASGDLIADKVLGQAALTTSASGSTATTLNGPNNSAIDPITGRIYVCDTVNNRVLGWPSAAGFQNGAAADLVIGQADFTANLANRGGAASNITLNAPNAVVVDSQGNLFVSDGNNNRVLIYTNPSIFDTIADIVIGQIDFTNVAAATTATGLNSPFGIHLDERGNLFVADSSNHRVLEYDSPYISSEAATRVWGQPNFTSAVVNNGGLSATSLNTPTGMDFDYAGNMYVADFGNNRVLGYTRNATGFPATTAVRVYGQPDFVTSTAGTTSTKMAFPEGIYCDINGSMYAVDRGNNRVLIFDAPLTSATATRVIGQATFTTSTAGSTDSTLNTPKGVTADDLGNLYVTDTNNNRVLRYDVVFTDQVPDTQYTSHDTVLIPAAATFGEGSPFPSTINVSNVTGVVTKVNVTLKHLSHTWPDDMDIYLIGPGGQGVKLMSDVGGSTDIYNITLIFDDSGASLPDAAAITAGTYKPTDFEADGPTINALGTALSVFNGVNPNGNWSLFAVDDVTTDLGEMFEWGLDIFTAPVIDSGPTATPSVASVGQTIAFTTSVTTSPGTMASVEWNFGDGTTGSGTTPTHAYLTAGTFTATVTVNDGISTAVTGTTSVTIVAASVGTGVDSDGDGFSDSFETAAGSDPLSALTTPLGGASADEATLSLPDVKLAIALNFAKANSDAYALAGTLLVPEGYTPAGKSAVVDVGGITKVFTLTSAGSATSGVSAIKIAIKGSASTAKFSVKSGKSALAATLLDEGLVNATTTANVNVPITVVFGNLVFAKTQTLSYKAAANKAGKTKQPKL